MSGKRLMRAGLSPEAFQLALSVELKIPAGADIVRGDSLSP